MNTNDIRARHTPVNPEFPRATNCDYCCSDGWPCDAVRATDEIDDLKMQLDVAFEMEREYIVRAERLEQAEAAIARVRDCEHDISHSEQHGDGPVDYRTGWQDGIRYVLGALSGGE